MTIFANIPFIVGLNANASSALWHIKDTAASRNKELRGDDLSDYLLSSELVVVNSPSPYFTFACPVGFSDIDLTVGDQCLDRVFDTIWEVNPDLGASDHNLIFIPYRSLAIRVFVLRCPSIIMLIFKFSVEYSWTLFMVTLSKRTVNFRRLKWRSP